MAFALVYSSRLVCAKYELETNIKNTTLFFYNEKSKVQMHNHEATKVSGMFSLLQCRNQMERMFVIYQEQKKTQVYQYYLTALFLSALEVKLSALHLCVCAYACV